jgi:hypothetical protein
VWPEGLGKLIKVIHLIRSRTHDLPACSIFKQYKILNNFTEMVCVLCLTVCAHGARHFKYIKKSM